MRIYILIASFSEYDDHEHWVLQAFSSETEAKELSDRLNLVNKNRFEANKQLCLKKDFEALDKAKESFNNELLTIWPGLKEIKYFETLLPQMEFDIHETTLP